MIIYKLKEETLLISATSFEPIFVKEGTEFSVVKKGEESSCLRCEGGTFMVSNHVLKERFDWNINKEVGDEIS